MSSFPGRSVLLLEPLKVELTPPSLLFRFNSSLRPAHSRSELAKGSSPEGPADKPTRKSRRPPKEKLPRGLRRYETTAVLRPDITEEERLDWTHRYDEAIIAGGALSVEFSNRGILPLSYSVKKRDMGGASKTYLEGVYMHIAYVTKPQSQLDLQSKFNADDDVIRTITVLLN